MKRVFWAIVALAILAPALFVPQAAAAAENLSLEMEAEIAVYSSSGETYIRSCGKSAALSELSGDEYYSYLIKFRHTGSQSVQVNEMTVSVDGGERWAWAAFTMEPIHPSADWLTENSAGGATERTPHLILFGSKVRTGAGETMLMRGWPGRWD